MEFSVRRLVSDAGTLITKAVQMTTGARAPGAEDTRGDGGAAEVSHMAERAEVTRRRTEGLLQHTHALLQPNPNIRMEEFLLEKLERRPSTRTTSLELLGHSMTEAANQLGPGTAYGRTLLRCGETQCRLGLAHRDFSRATSAGFLRPLRSFLESECKIIARERKQLDVKRCALEECAGRTRRATTAQHIALAERQEELAREDFGKQLRSVKHLLEGIDDVHAAHLQGLRDFVEAQAALFAVGHSYLAALQRQLNSVEASFRPSDGSTEVAGGGDAGVVTTATRALAQRRQQE